MAENITRSIPDAQLTDASLRFWRSDVGSTTPERVRMELSAVMVASDGEQLTVSIERTIQQARTAGIFASDTARDNFLTALANLRDWLRTERNLAP